jgi:hypothetical protein
MFRHLRVRAPASANEMSFLSLPTSTPAGRPVAHLLGQEQVPMVHRRKGLMVEEAPCPPVVSSAKGDKIKPVAAQMASY